MLYIPLAAHPIGWIILGCGGYLLYQNGKKKGHEEASAARNTAVQTTVKPQEDSQKTDGGE